MIKKEKIEKLSIEIILLIFIIVFLAPFIMIFYNSLKSYSEIMTDVLALPKKISWENYLNALKLMKYPRVFLNTFIVTILGIAGIVLFGSMAGYKLARTKTRYSKFLLLVFILPMIIPFHTFMIPLTQIARLLHFTNIPGLGVIYWGLGLPFVMFLYHGFVKTIPTELDEAASIDGCNIFQTFFIIIFPQLKSITVTIIVLNAMWIWNDFLLPLLLVNSCQATRTLQLAAFTFFGQYKHDWHYGMAAMILVIWPAVLFFIIMQKHIIKGISAGALKG